MPRAAKAANAGDSRLFSEQDAFVTWRIVARNPTYTGETEKVGFSNGQATLSGLPKSSKCTPGCGADGDLCRLHDRVFHLNNLLNYPSFQRSLDERTNRRVTARYEGYRVLSEVEYEAEYGDGSDELLDIDSF